MSLSVEQIECVLVGHRLYIDSYEDIRCLCGEICVRDHNPNRAFSDGAFISHVAACILAAVCADLAHEQADNLPRGEKEGGQ